MTDRETTAGPSGPPLEEPRAPVPAPARYADLALPPYRFVPGLNAHPRTDPAGHLHGRPEVVHPPWRPERWRELTRYLHAVDLYNLAYWWEAHETLEALWLAAGRTTPPARFVQGLIQLAAAHLNRHLGKGGEAQAERALGHVETTAALPGNQGASPDGRYMGLAVAPFVAATRAHFAGQGPFTPIVLGFDEEPSERRR